MAKESGLGATVSVDDSAGTLRDISNDVTDFSIDTPRAEQVTTGVDKSATAIVQLLADGAFTLRLVRFPMGLFQPGANQN